MYIVGEQQPERPQERQSGMRSILRGWYELVRKGGRDRFIHGCFGTLAPGGFEVVGIEPCSQGG